MNQPDPIASSVRQHHLFSSFDDTQFEKISSQMQIVTVQNGDLLFRQGQKADCFFMVVAGKIKLFLESASGDQKIIEIIPIGQTFAEAVMFMERIQYPVYAEAIGKSTLYSFQSESFIAALKNSTQVSMRLLGSLSMKLHRMLGEIESLALENATHRFVRYLLRQVTEQELNTVQLQLPISKQALASRLSIQPETLSRIIKHLADEGILAIDGRMIEIISVERLKNF